MDNNPPTIPVQPFRVALICHRESDNIIEEFIEFSMALNWAWEQLRPRVAWGDRASFLICQGDQIIVQVIASERVGMYDRASEQYALPAALRREDRTT